jgi:hypothetical protein
LLEHQHVTRLCRQEKRVRVSRHRVLPVHAHI